MAKDFTLYNIYRSNESVWIIHGSAKINFCFTTDKSSKNFPRNYTAPELFILYCSGDKVGYNLPLGLGFKVPDQF